MSSYNPIYMIQIMGTKENEVNLNFSFNPMQEIDNAELEEIISIAKELQKTLKKLRETSFSQKRA